MRIKTVQIVWHGTENGKEPVYSLDFHPGGTLMTAGGDREIKAWKVEQGEDGQATVTYTGSLVGHSKTVNCVRFSPTGEWMVSAGDGGEILLWRPSEGEVPRGNLLEGTPLATWRQAGRFRGHNDDVMDVSWSADGTSLVSGSIDNKSIVWDLSEKRRGQQLLQLREHRHYTQGVAWDPAQQHIVTQSADRTCIVHALRPPAAGKKGKGQGQQLLACETAKDFHTHKTLKKWAMGAGGEAGKHSLFQDEGAPTFFRRLAWSPDGSFLAVPAGEYKDSPNSKPVNTAFIYSRNHWGSPVLHLPGHSKPVVAVRFCPVIFKREREPHAQAQQQQQQQKEEEAAALAAVGDGAVEVEVQPAHAPQGAGAPAGPFDLPYKMVFAVATLDSVVLYSTDSLLPLAVLGQLHFDSITDLAWSSDAKYLAVSSRDCYCSIACFDEGELGTPVLAEELPPHIAARMAAAQRTAPPAAPQVAATPGPAPKPSQQRAKSATPSQSKLATSVAAGAPAPAPAMQAQQEQGAGAAPGPAGQQAQQGQVQQCKQERKRIQPELVVVSVGGQQQQQQGQMQEGEREAGQEVKRRRITPEAVGPAPAVVGDSQAGTQVFPAVPAPARKQPGNEQDQKSATKRVKRIVPEPIGPIAGAAAAAAAGAGGVVGADGSVVAGGQLAPSGDDVAAGGCAAPAAAVTATAKPAKRITPIPVVAPAAQQAAPAPTESGSVVGAASKAAKRINPTPIKALQEVSCQFENAKQASYAPPPSELSRDGCGGGSGNVRRITPVLLAATSPLPEVADSRPPAAAAKATAKEGADAGTQGAAAAAAGGSSGGFFNIAELAMAAGRKAAKEGQ